MQILSLCFTILFVFTSIQGDAFLASVKAMGMAGACLAYPVDSLAGAYNPAGMVLVGDRIDLGGYGVCERGKITVSKSPIPHANGEYNNTNYTALLFGDFGINAVWDNDCSIWSLGLMAYPRSFQKTRFNRPFPLFGNTKPCLEYINYTIAPVLAMEFCGCHAFGVSLDWEIQSLKVNGLEHLAHLSKHPHHTSNGGRNYSHGVSATVGWRWQATNWMAIGAVYQPKVHMSKFKKHRGLHVNGRLDLPERWGAGIQLHPLESLVVCCDVEGLNWENVSSLHNKFLNEKELNQFGTKNGPGFGRDKQTGYRVGVEYRLTDCWTVRAGYRHAGSPIRNSETLLNALTIDTVEDYVTAGTTCFWGECCGETSTFFAYGFKNQIAGKNAIPRKHFRGGNLAIEESKFIAGMSVAWFY